MSGKLAPVTRPHHARWAAFANPEVTVRSWYVAGLSRRLQRHRLYAKSLLGRRVVMWRDAMGQAAEIVDSMERE